MIDLKDNIEFQKGDIPLVFSVPHGGKLKCNNIPERTTGIRGIDGETIEIVKKLISLIENIYEEQNLGDISLSYIISKVPRSRIDFIHKRLEPVWNLSLVAQGVTDSAWPVTIHESLSGRAKELDVFSLWLSGGAGRTTKYTGSLNANDENTFKIAIFVQ